jgi:hypothetical protein
MAHQFKNFNRDEKRRFANRQPDRPFCPKRQSQTQDEQKQSAKKRARRHHPHIGRRDGVQPVANALKKTPLRVEMHPPQKLVEHVRQILVRQRKDTQASSNSASAFDQFDRHDEIQRRGALLRRCRSLCVPVISGFSAAASLTIQLWANAPVCRRRGDESSRCPSTPASRPACRNQSSRRTACPPRPGARNGGQSNPPSS